MVSTKTLLLKHYYRRQGIRFAPPFANSSKHDLVAHDCDCYSGLSVSVTWPSVRVTGP